MNESRSKNVIRSIKWGMIEKIVTLGGPFIVRTIMIYSLGELYLGLNGLFASVLQVFNVAELGISNAIIYSMYKPLAENNTKVVNALLNFYKKCYKVIGFIIMIVGLISLVFVNNLIAGDVPKDINVYILYLLYLFNTVISYELFAYKTSLLTANQRNDVVSRIRTIVYIFQIFLQIIFMVVFKNYYLFITAIIASTIINNLIAAHVSKIMYPQYYCDGSLSKGAINDIKTKVNGMFFQKIGGIILSSVDTIVISSFLGLRILAQYQNYYYIISALFGVLGIVMQSMVAPIGNSIVLETREKNYKDFNRFNYICICAVTWITVFLLCDFQPFMRIWVGDNLMLSNNTMILFVIYFFVHKWCDMLYIYQDSTGIWWETRFVPLVSSILNLVLNISLVQVIGLPGILISTIISVILIYDVGYAVVLFKAYFKEAGNIRFFFITQIKYFLIAIIISTSTYLVCYVLPVHGVFELLINSTICMIIPPILFVFFYRKTDEFKNIVSRIGSTFPRKKDR